MTQSKMLSLAAVIDVVGISKSTINRLIKAGLFPAKIAVSERRRAFLASDIEAYLQNCQAK